MLERIFGYFRRRHMKTLKPFGKHIDSNSLRIHFCDSNEEMCVELARAFAEVETVEVLVGNLLDITCDALLSPANSFGDMGGGVDKVIDDFFQNESQRRVMQVIRDHYFGELPVGIAHIVPMQHKRFPFLICAPTMRIASNVSQSINAYLSFRAALIAVQKHNEITSHPIRSLASTGLCTGVGGMSYNTSAKQMRAAYDMIMAGKWREVIHPVMAPFTFHH